MFEGCAYYVYAIARRKPGGGAGAEPLPGVDPRYPVREVTYGDVLALVSDVSLVEYDLESLRVRFQDAHWLELLARGHQRVIEELNKSYTLLPLKLCTLYTDEANLHKALEANSVWVGSALDQVEGAQEWGVKAFCDREALARWATQEQPQLRQLASTVSAASPGARYMLEKRLQRAAQQAADDLRRREIEVIGRHLAAEARAAQVSPIQPQQAHGHAEEMVLNGAYLVAEADLASFRSALNELVETYCPHGFSFELTGPWPAYSFSMPRNEESA